jgi:lysozyme
MNVQDLITKHEGLRLKPYKDSRGYITIGIGRCLDTKGISGSEANLLFTNDVAEAMTACQRILPASWDSLDPVRQAALIDMCFNIGEHGLTQFRVMLAAIGKQDWKAASLAMSNSVWAAQVPSRAKDLMYMMETGQWPTT